MTDAADPLEAEELERARDWRIKRVGDDPADRQSAAAARLLQHLADDVRRRRGSAAHVEYLAIRNWLGEFDVMDDFAALAEDYRRRIGVDHFPPDADAYLRALTALARDVAGV